MPSFSTTTWSPASPSSLPPQSFSCYPYALRLFLSLINPPLTYTTTQPCAPQCLYVLRAYAITGAKRWSLLIYLPCLFGHLFIICWYSVKEMTLWKDVFLILGRTGCFPVTYNDFPVCSMGFLASRSWFTNHHIYGWRAGSRSNFQNRIFKNYKSSWGWGPGTPWLPKDKYNVTFTFEE